MSANEDNNSSSGGGGKGKGESTEPVPVAEGEDVVVVDSPDAVYIDQSEVAEEIVLDDDGEPPVEGEEGEDYENADFDFGDGFSMDYDAEGNPVLIYDEGGEGEAEEVDVEAVDMSFKRIELHSDSVFCVATSPVADSDVFATGGCDDKAYVWRVNTEPTELICIDGHTDSVVSIAFNFDGSLVASGGMDGNIFVYEVESGNQVAHLDGPEEVTWLAWHPRGNVLLAGSSDTTMWLWSLPRGDVMNVMSGHADVVGLGMFTHDGKSIVSGSDDCTVRVWNPKDGATTLKLEGDLFHTAPVTAMALKDDDTMLMSGDYEGRLLVTNLSSGKVVSTLIGHRESVEAVGWCQSHAFAASGCVGGTLCIWDTSLYQLRSNIQHGEPIVRLKWSENTSALLYTCCLDRVVRVIDGRAGVVLHELTGHRNAILDMTIKESLGYIVTCSDDYLALVYEIPETEPEPEPVVVDATDSGEEVVSGLDTTLMAGRAVVAWFLPSNVPEGVHHIARAYAASHALKAFLLVQTNIFPYGRMRGPPRQRFAVYHVIMFYIVHRISRLALFVTRARAAVVATGPRMSSVDEFVARTKMSLIRLLTLHGPLGIILAVLFDELVFLGVLTVGQRSRLVGAPPYPELSLSDDDCCICQGTALDERLMNFCPEPRHVCHVSCALEWFRSRQTFAEFCPLCRQKFRTRIDVFGRFKVAFCSSFYRNTPSVICRVGVTALLIELVMVAHSTGALLRAWRLTRLVRHNVPHPLGAITGRIRAP